MQEQSILKEPQNQVPSQQPVDRARFSQSRVPPKRQMKKIWLILFLVVIIIIAGTLFLFSRPDTKSEESAVKEEETSFDTFTFEEEETPSPSPTEAPVDKGTISIQVLNGTGIAKQAAFLEEELIKLGYENITLGNAEAQDKETTKATFSLDVPNQVRQEIFDRLEELYQRVETEAKDIDNADISIIAGLRKGQELPSPTPTTTPTSDNSEEEEEATSSADN